LSYLDKGLINKHFNAIFKAGMYFVKCGREPFKNNTPHCPVKYYFTAQSIDF